MNRDQLIQFITEIPDLRHHRYVDTDGEISLKLHTDQEVAERIADAFAAADLAVRRDWHAHEQTSEGTTR